jgi:hypothetical protein
VIFIPLEEPPILPKWLPKTRLWVGVKRWGPSGAAIAIEARVQEQGGELHEETVQERSTRLKRELNFSERRDKFLNSVEGVRAATQEFEFFDREIQKLVMEIKDSLNLNIKRDIKPFAAEKQIVILGFELGLKLIWKCPYNNTLDKSALIFQLWDEHPPFPGIINFDAKMMKELKFKLDVTPSDKYIWQTISNNNQYDTKYLASFVLKQFMNEVQKHKIRK